MKYTLEGKPIGHKVPHKQVPGKIHWGCRSTETFILKSWKELGIDIDIDEMDAGTRASMDGQVPVGTIFIEWIYKSGN